MIRAVIFDMDGLLIDSEPLWREAEIKVFKSIGLNFTEDMCRQTMGMRIDEVVSFWYNQFKWEKHSKNEIENSIVNELIYLVKQKGELLPGVLNVLNEFKDNNIPMAIASSSSMKIINAVATTFKIEKYFSIIHSAEFEDYGKPHPQVFISTSTKLNVPAEECLVFEDSKHGMIAALAAKMKVIVIPEINSPKEDWHLLATRKLNSLNDFVYAEFMN